MGDERRLDAVRNTAAGPHRVHWWARILALAGTTFLVISAIAVVHVGPPLPWAGAFALLGAFTLLRSVQLGVFGPATVKGVEVPWRGAFAPDPTEVQHVRRREAAVVETTLSPADLHQLQLQGYLEIASALHDGRVYRLRPGRRIEVRCPEDHPQCPLAYLCVLPSYPLPAGEFLAQMAVYLRGAELRVLSTGRWMATDASIPNTF